MRLGAATLAPLLALALIVPAQAACGVGEALFRHGESGTTIQLAGRGMVRAHAPAPPVPFEAYRLRVGDIRVLAVGNAPNRLFVNDGTEAGYPPIEWETPGGRLPPFLTIRDANAFLPAGRYLPAGCAPPS